MRWATPESFSSADVAKTLRNDTVLVMKLFTRVTTLTWGTGGSCDLSHMSSASAMARRPRAAETMADDWPGLRGSRQW